MSCGRTFEGNSRIYNPLAVQRMIDQNSDCEASPVIKYQLSEEERAKYKPVPKKVKK